MSPEEFRAAGHTVVDWLADFLSHPEAVPVLSRAQPGDLIDRLPVSAPDLPEPFSVIMADFENQIVPSLTHWNHPGFMAYFATSSSGPGILAELLTAGLNANGILWKTSPGLTELEQVTLDWLRQWLGLPKVMFGIIYDTASTSSMHAIAAAREAKAPEVRVSGGVSDLILYCSEHAHSSIEKGAIVVGVGKRNVRKIPVDAEFRMDTAALESAIAADVIIGLRPFCVVATLGTTSTTSIDPVNEIADVVERHGMWLHVDAAYAGSAAIVPELQPLFSGWERADSIVMNPHKWLLVPLDLSVLYTRRPDVLRRAFSLVPEYLRTQENPRALNYMEYGIPLGRRFRALKLWFVMRYYGRDQAAAIIRDQLAMAQGFAALVAADDRFELSAPFPFSVVCFRLKSSNEANESLMHKVNRCGEVFLSHTVLHGNFVIRIAIGNMGTRREHVQRAWWQISEAAPERTL